eukprot:46686-Amphidinium_carterae.1
MDCSHGDVAFGIKPIHNLFDAHWGSTGRDVGQENGAAVKQCDKHHVTWGSREYVVQPYKVDQTV